MSQKQLLGKTRKTAKNTGKNGHLPTLFCKKENRENVKNIGNFDRKDWASAYCNVEKELENIGGSLVLQPDSV